MELKRILARDTRSATEQAIALYGPDVLVISNHQVDGQTELVVALDVQPEPAPAAVVAPAAPTFQRSFMQAQQMSAAEVQPLVAKASGPVADKESEKAMEAAVEVPAVRLSSITPNFSSAPLPAAAIPAAPAVPVSLLNPLSAAPGVTEPAKPEPAALESAPAPTAPVVDAAAPAPAATAVSATAPMAMENTSAQAAELQAQARDLQRSHELVDLVRGEIAALRREFRLSQQSSAWQSGLQLHPSLGVLVNALNEAQVPMALRALLMDALQGQNDPHQALAVWRSQLEHSLARPQQAMPSQGLHVLAGPSGSGKTMMCARLAHHASALHGSERLALISYRDHRAGAWSQIQMLGAQLGIDCFRANDEDALRLLVGELGTRSLVLIDTPGVQMSERLAEIKAVAPQAALHAVVSADASGAALRRVLVDADVDWHSVMLSKLDETESPWALLQLFSDNHLKLSCASGGSRMTDLMSTFTLPQLIDLALAPMLSQATTPMASQAMLVSSDAPSFVKVALETLEPAPVAQAVVIQAVAPELVPPPAKVAKARTPRKAVAAAPAPTRATRPARSTLKTQTAPTSA
jgi:flagellar biosynthesis GTPase FlhF